MIYREHIQSRTGLQILSSTSPSVVDLNSYLTTGIREVITNTLKFSPQAGLLFATESDEQEANGFKVDSGLVYAVVREDGNDERWRPARQVDIDKEYLVTDEDSLFFASKYNPVYVRDADNNINVYPSPSSGNNAFKVTYIEYPLYDNHGFDIGHETDLDKVGIKNFPTSFHPHLIMYGAIKALKQYYHYLIINDEDVELAETFLKTATQMQENYVQMFITKDILTSAQQQQQQAPRQRRARRTRA